jgi:dipeptidyl aminopeptidase/acylaminoacyl peptidase
MAFLSRDGNLPQPGVSSLHVMPASGGPTRSITDADLNVQSFAWAADGGSIWLNAGKGVRGTIVIVPRGGGEPRVILGGQYVASSLTLSSNGTVAYLRHDPHHPPDVFARTEDGVERQRSRMNPQVAELSLGRAEVVRWPSTDGREIEGVLHLPADYAPGKRLPLVVQAHGGPSGVYTLGFPGSWGNYAHCYTGRGWAVFQPNFRGSSNYGDRFLRLNVKDWGGGDFQDIMSGVDYLIRRDTADPERMAFHGWSYGGYLTAWTITQTARFKAAACGAGVTNMFSMYSTNDLQRTLENYFGGEPWDDVEAYHRASALYHIKNARTPTLILHGEQDKRVPIGQAQELYMGLLKNGIPVEMVVYPREPHGLGEPNHQLDKMKREMAWFEKYVLGESSPATTARR